MYGFVRHPMYFGALFLLGGTPLALGSWWPLLLIPFALIILYFRIANEEKVLLRDHASPRAIAPPLAAHWHARGTLTA
jgi:protein-S-isoprenylcysteine O-methyltransferase Ste14